MNTPKTEPYPSGLRAACHSQHSSGFPRSYLASNLARIDSNSMSPVYYYSRHRRELKVCHLFRNNLKQRMLRERFHVTPRVGVQFSGVLIAEDRIRAFYADAVAYPDGGN